jgi:hypothetical protein
VLEDPNALRETVERLHGCKATLREVVAVKERFRGETVWEGVVHVFDLQGQPSAAVCYAWSSPVEGSKQARFYAVLRIKPVDTPVDAVRAAIVADCKQH